MKRRTLLASLGAVAVAGCNTPRPRNEEEPIETSPGGYGLPAYGASAYGGE